MHSVVRRLLASPQSFNLFQAISLLERVAPHKKGVATGLGVNEAVRLKAAVGLQFQPSDIQSIAEPSGPHAPHTVVSGVMSLAGSGGPLPIPFTELLLAQRRARDDSGLDFLDIFNQRLLGQLYSARKKHHLSLQASSWKRSAQVKAVKAASGVGFNHASRNWLRHSSLHGAAPRTVGGLLVIVADRLGLSCHAKSFVGRWVEHGMNAGVQLGGKRHKALVLGVNSELGGRVWCQDKAIELVAKPSSLAQYESLLPGGEAFADLTDLVDDYFQSEIKVVFSPLAPQRQAAALSGSKGLGRSPARLGLTSWLASSPKPSAQFADCSCANPRLNLGSSSYSSPPSKGL
jgi:type VI secretion system protein ImpH